MTNEEIINQFLNDDETINVLSDEEIIRRYNVILDYLDSIKPKARTLLAVEPRATSGSFKTNTITEYGVFFYVTFSWSVASQSVANNTTTINYSAVVTTDGPGYTRTCYARQLVIDGKTVGSASATTKYGSGATVFSGSTTINHNADGSKTFSASFKIQVGRKSYNVTGSGSWALTTIPRASTPTLSASSVEMGKQVTIYTNRASSAFTHTIKFDFGSYSETIATGVGASFVYDVQTAMASYVPNATSGTGTFTLYTYNGATLIGTKTVNVTLTVPASIVPAIDGASTTEQNSAVTMGFFVQSQSQIKVVITARGAYGSSITDYSATFEGVTYKGDTFTISNVPTAGDRTLKVTVKDSRGRTTTYNRTISVTAYAKPAINAFNAFRCNASGVEDDGGSYVKFTYNFAITSLSDKNGRVVKIQYKLSTASDWIDLVSLSGYSGNSTYLSGAIFDPNHSYNVRLYVADTFNSTTKQLDIGTEAVTVDYLTGGQGMGLGKVAELEDTLDVAWDGRFRNDLQVDNRLINQNDKSTVLTRNKWWSSSESHNVDDAISGINFVYPNHDAPDAGTMVTFNGIGPDNDNTGYSWQMLVAYLNGVPYIRARNGDINEWGEWSKILRLNPSNNATKDSIYALNNVGAFMSRTTQGNDVILVFMGPDNAVHVGTNNVGASVYNVFIGNVWFAPAYPAVYPNVDGTFYLGISNQKWRAIYATNGTIQTSDRNLKHDIKKIDDKYISLFKMLKPITYIMNDGERVHVGFISQDVEEAMQEVGLTDLEFAGFCKDKKQKEVEIKGTYIDENGEEKEKIDRHFEDVLDEDGNPEYTYSLRYEEFIALNTRMIQDLMAKVEDQQKIIDEQNKRLETLEAEILAIKDLIK